MTGEFICGIDTGGTFTDCVVVDGGRAHRHREGAVDARRLLPGGARLAGHRRGPARLDHRGAPRPDLAPRPRHDRRDQRAPPAARRQGRAHHDAGASRRHPHHAGRARRARPRQREGPALPREQQARSAHRPQDPDRGGERAGRLQGRGGRRAERGGGGGGHPPARGEGRGGHRDLLPVVVQAARARAAGQGDGGAHRPGRVRLLLRRPGARAGASTSGRRPP